MKSVEKSGRGRGPASVGEEKRMIKIFYTSMKMSMISLLINKNIKTRGDCSWKWLGGWASWKVISSLGPWKVSTHRGYGVGQFTEAIEDGLTAGQERWSCHCGPHPQKGFKSEWGGFQKSPLQSTHLPLFQASVFFGAPLSCVANTTGLFLLEMEQPVPFCLRLLASRTNLS